MRCGGLWVLVLAIFLPGRMGSAGYLDAPDLRVCLLEAGGWGIIAISSTLSLFLFNNFIRFGRVQYVKGEFTFFVLGLSFQFKPLKGFWLLHCAWLL